MKYNWQLAKWPDFVYKVQEIQPLIIKLAEETGQVNGMVIGLPDDLKQETLLQVILTEAIKTSAIEGEIISREDVMSSIRNNLGLNNKPVNIKDQRAAGVARLMIAVRDSFDQPLSTDVLLNWHSMLMAGAKHINAGRWRKGKEPMQVVSGNYERQVIHYEAPPSSQVPQEMERFVKWYNTAEFPLKGNIAEAVLKSAVAHLYFESIHPFEDGNGRIGRAIAEKALSKSLGQPVMFSLSKTIESNKAAYYNALTAAQRSLEITPWINYFIAVVLDAQRDAKTVIQFTLKKAHFFNRYKTRLNERQLKAVNKMMEKGDGSFTGGMTAKKYVSINKISKATATRDLQELQQIGALTQEGAGRSVSYYLNLV